MSSSITQYLRSGLILSSQSPQYDDKGRQLPFQESTSQRRERHAFVNSSQCQRNVAKWMHDQGYVHSATTDTHSSSTSSSESSSPRTPASPLAIPHTHPDNYALHQQKMKLQTAEALDAELTKLILASRHVHPPQHRQSRNYKNLHLANTNTTRYQPQSRITPPASQPQRVQVPAFVPTRGIFDSPSSVFSSYHSSSHHTNNIDEELDSGEPYIFYSSSSSFSTCAPRSGSTLPSINLSTTKPQAAGIGEFPYPASLSSPSSSSPSSSSSSSPFHSQSISSPAPLTSPSSSSSPRIPTSRNSCSTTGSASPRPRVGDH
ncbi:hypothetical protein D9756_008060 [Leucocoprinus leucothites]|uniref:Uncharacterized protein n=1 Tax=Leucocoprinus leucothites TaxID=201217 RepID=A0A8H5D4C5_9AGAR|nr:hypothetical protein D9756_008060 [Leucoagaricus leucothites]